MAHQTQADQRAGKVEQVAEQLGATLVTDASRRKSSKPSDRTLAPQRHRCAGLITTRPNAGAAGTGRVEERLDGGRLLLPA
jgi:hypothetical protein